jgi:uncharacterized protein YfaS (alpha-2-macroglobulin family)
MKTARPLALVSFLVLGLAAFFLVGPRAQEGTPGGDAALTYQRYPYSFDSSRPLRPDSAVLLRFNAPVVPDAVEGGMRLYDHPNDRFSSVVATRPTRAELGEFIDDPEPDLPLDRFVVIRPASPLPLGGTWYLNAPAGLASSDGRHRLAEGNLDYLGELDAFEVGEISALSQYDNGLQIEIGHNKWSLAEEFDAARLAEFVSVAPAPEDLKILSRARGIRLAGAFEYGAEYRVSVRAGLVASDSTRLEDGAEAVVTFVPNEGFLTYPAFSTTQNASGHRRFDVKTGNLTGLRTRVKRLDGKDLILALRDYQDKYEGWGEKQSLAFEAIAGLTIYDEFRPSEAGLDQTETVSLDWDELTEGATTGAYYLCSEGESATRENYALGAQSLVQLTDIGLAWKQGEDGTAVYAFSLKSGRPLPGLSLALRDENAAPLAETRTDEGGLARIGRDLYREREGRLYLDASLGEDRHAIQFHEDLNSMGLWSFGLDQRWDDPVAGERRTLVFTDRDVYRPGDEVKVKAISRFVDADRLLGQGEGKARLRLFDALHRRLFEREVAFGPNGSYDGDFTLPGEGMGWHTLELDFNPAGEDGAEEGDVNWRLIETYAFRVEDYRVNTFEVGVAAPDELDGAAELSIPVSARYFMGKPLSQAELEWTAYASADFPRPRGFDEFQFGNRTRSEPDFSAEGTAALSSKGEAQVELSLPPQTTHPGPRRVHLVASVTDANQQTLSGSKRFLVHSSDFYLGLRRPEGVHRAGDTATFSLAAVAASGEAHAAPVEVSVLVEKENWTTVKVMGANGRMVHRNELRLRTVSDERLVLATEVDPATGLVRAQPHGIAFAEAGDYQITLTARDARGRDVLTKVGFTVIGAEEPSWSWYDVIRIDLVPDKTSYAPGETARLLARSPVFGHALFSLERGGVREVRSLAIDRYETLIEVPVGEGDAPNLFASLLVIRGSDDSPHVHRAADHRLGYCQILVDDPAAALSTTVTAGETESYQPGEEIEFAATVLDHAGAPVAEAEVTLYAVDEGVLSLTGYETPDPGAVFHAPFPLAVWTGQSLGDLLPENPNEQDFMNKGYVIGGGGGGFGVDPERLRKDFKALALWEASLLTDADGVVRAKAIAPDNLTSFRVMAVVAEGNRFGRGEARVVINKPLMIEPALPRFSNLADQIDVAAVLHNTTSAAQEVEVRVSLDGHAVFLGRIGETIPTSLAPAPDGAERVLKLSLPAGATETVSFPIGLVATGEAKWQWKVRSLTDPALRDGTESTLEVGYPLPLLRETRTFALRDGQGLADALAEVDRRLLQGDGSLRVSLSNSRLVEAGDGLDYLLGYPYGCVEQTTSSLIPWLTMRQFRKVLPQVGKSEDEVASVLGKGLARIFSMQTGDGGLAYWPGGDESVLWGSAYAGVAVALAQRDGVAVPMEPSLALWDYLSLQLRGAAEVEGAYDLSQRCLAAYALALADRAEPAYHEILFEKRRFLTGEARALLALAMTEAGAAPPARITALLSPDPKLPVAEVSWYRRPYVAATRLLAEVRSNPASPAVEGLVDELMKLREARNGWGSTYSNAWPLVALAAYAEASAAKLGANRVELAFGEESRTLELPAEPASDAAEFDYSGKGEARALSLRAEGKAPVYASVSLAARPALMPMEPENRGFSIQRRYEKVELDGAIVPAENLRVGDLVLVTLDLNLPNERESYLAIDDALPAIFEAVNPEFRTSETRRVNAARGARTLWTSHRELRKDRVLFFADSVFGAGDYQLQYLARVVAPGEVTAPPAKIEAMYEPQRFGLSGSGRIAAAPRALDPGEVAAR